MAERTLFRARAGDEQASASSSTVPAEAPAATRRSRWRLWSPPAAAAATPGGARAARRTRFPSGRGRGDARDERRCGEGCPAARPDIACRRAPVARGASPRPGQSSSEASRSRAFAPDDQRAQPRGELAPLLSQAMQVRGGRPGAHLRFVHGDSHGRALGTPPFAWKEKAGERCVQRRTRSAWPCRAI